MMSETVWLAIIVAFTTGFTATIPPMIMSILNARTRRIDRERDYARQDAVATRVAAATHAAATTAKAFENKLDVIHVLVNSNLTAARQSEYAALAGQLVLIREIIALRGDAPSPATLDNIGSIERKIAELKIVLEGQEFVLAREAT